MMSKTQCQNMLTSIASICLIFQSCSSYKFMFSIFFGGVQQQKSAKSPQCGALRKVADRNRCISGPLNIPFLVEIPHRRRSRGCGQHINCRAEETIAKAISVLEGINQRYTCIPCQIPTFLKCNVKKTI